MAYTPKNFFPAARTARANYDTKKYNGEIARVIKDMDKLASDFLLLKPVPAAQVNLEYFTLQYDNIELNHYKYNDINVWHFLSGLRKMSKYTLYFYYMTVTEKEGEWHMREHGPVTLGDVPPCENIMKIIWTLLNYMKNLSNIRVKKELINI